MKQQTLSKILVIILITVNCIFMLNWIMKKGSTEVYAQQVQPETEVGRYQLEYVPSIDGSDPRYILFDTATGVFWEAKGRIENIDYFCIYAASDLRTGNIGDHIISIHKHK